MAAGDALVEGPKDPKELLEVKGIRETQQYLVEEVQKVYRDQGVSIHDKHIELIVRQMLRRVLVAEPGDAPFLPGERVDAQIYAEVNREPGPESKRPAEGRPELMGITKASLATDSWLSAASFQETTRVLTEAAIEGKSDQLFGLKENIIIGKLIPAGTGHGALPGHRRRHARRRGRALAGPTGSTRRPRTWPPGCATWAATGCRRRPVRASQHRRQLAGRRPGAEDERGSERPTPPGGRRRRPRATTAGSSTPGLTGGDRPVDRRADAGPTGPGRLPEIASCREHRPRRTGAVPARCRARRSVRSTAISHQFQNRSRGHACPRSTSWSARAGSQSSPRPRPRP